MPTFGIPRFNALTILEIEGIDYRAGAPALVAHAAFVDTRTGKTFGSTVGRVGWSAMTLAKLEELRLSMEEDMARLVFEEDSVEQPRINMAGSVTGRTSSQHPNYSNTPKGIGEELEDEDARSI
jgi:hypothetical protein